MEKVVNQFVEAVLTDLLNNYGVVILEPNKIESEFYEYYYKFSVKNECNIALTFLLRKYRNSHGIGVFIESIKMEDDFMLSDWLKYEGYKFDKDPFTFATYHADDLDLQIEGVINFLREIFENKKLKEILEGRYWDETPFDWAGMR
jgi:hypothetical protein